MFRAILKPSDHHPTIGKKRVQSNFKTILLLEKTCSEHFLNHPTIILPLEKDMFRAFLKPSDYHPTIGKRHVQSNFKTIRPSTYYYKKNVQRNLRTIRPSSDHWKKNLFIAILKPSDPHPTIYW